MKLATQQPEWLLPLLSALVASAVVAAVWIGALTLGADPQPTKVIRSVFIPAYSSLDELSAHADAVVVGTVENVAAKWTDRGAGGDGIPRPYILYQLDAQEALKGETADSIYILRIEPVYFAGDGHSALSGVPLTELLVGQTVALYLEEVIAETPPVITITDRFYVPLSLDNGVFDVSRGASGVVARVNDDTVVRPRGIRKDMFAEGSKFRLSAVKQAIEPVSGDAVPGAGPSDAGSVGSVY